MLVTEPLMLHSPTLHTLQFTAGCVNMQFSELIHSALTNTVRFTGGVAGSPEPVQLVA